MSVRNCQELGVNLQKMTRRLMANADLIKLLYYEDQDPLNHPALSAQELEEQVFEKLVKTVPRIGTKDTAKSVIVIYIQKAQKLSGNSEFRGVHILVDVVVPLSQWSIKDTNLRPFAILGKVQESLDGKTVNGLGKIRGGDFELNFITEDVICYQQRYKITEYD